MIRASRSALCALRSALYVLRRYSVPEFVYDARATSGQRTKGTLTANSEREVLAMLDARGLFPVSIKAAQVVSQGRSWGGRVKGRHMAAFYSHLADLLLSGVPLVRSPEM